VTLKSLDLHDLRVGTRVQSMSTSHNGEIALVDIPSKIIWIKWNVTGAIIPHQHKMLSDVYPIDN
jgi:hypothetical protein